MKRNPLLAPAPLIGYLSVIVVAGLLALLATGCGDDDDHETVIKIAGQHSVEVGQSLALSASTVHGTDSGYTWKSNDPTIATVDTSGVVSAVAEGETAIVATGVDTGASAEHALVVVPAGANTPRVVISGQNTVEVGKTLTLSATTQNGSDSSYAWSAADETVATVDASGVVTGVATGSTTVSARGADTSVSGDHLVVVVPAGSAMVEISGVPAVVVGATTQLSAATKGGSDASYTWSSSDETLATVDATGLVTGLAEGQVSIMATGTDSGAKGALAMVVATEIPNSTKWLGSGHADRTAEAFNHWNSETPPEVPTSCAKCHSTPGFRDFIGDDGSAADKVDKAAAVGTVINCTACHNPTASKLSHVVFPSGVKVENLGPEARCMTCHQGRSSTDQVDKAITDAAVTGDDTVSSNLNFLNIHYYAAGATLNAGRVRGGYQYTGQTYDWRFRHAKGLDTCVDCHDPHSLEVRIDECKKCHTAVSAAADLKKIRMIDSNRDYDGDGNTTEGIYDEMVGLQALLLEAIQGYAKDKSLGSAICYDKASYPYFFKDTDGDGTCSATEAVSANGFDKWTARLVRAAYNYQVSQKDPGAFAHNAKYIIQLLYDSISDLNTVLTTSKVDLSKAVRNDFGHFNGAGEPARHWDEDEEVEGSCAKCHSGSEGFRFYLKYGTNITVDEPDNGLDCYTCHQLDTTASSPWTLVSVDSVTYPSNKTITNVGAKGNICSTCHSGRESKATVDARIASGSLGFRNVHYLPAAAVKNGADAQVGYEYTGKTYAKAWKHAAGDDCTYCHDPKLSKHTFQVADAFTKCTACHGAAAKPEEIRMPLHNKDYDGDGSSTEPLADEVTTLSAALLAQIQISAGANKICYDAGSYPYWFKDTDGDGSCSAAEAVFANGYGSWTAALMKAAFNYQLSRKEPGAWAHNFDYIVELLIDSIADLGGATTSYIRP